MEDDTTDHDVGSELRVTAFGVGGGCGHATSGSLQGEGEDIDADEDPEVEIWGEERVFSADDVDELFEDVVDAGGEEGRGCAGQDLLVIGNNMKL